VKRGQEGRQRHSAPVGTPTTGCGPVPGYSASPDQRWGRPWPYRPFRDRPGTHRRLGALSAGFGGRAAGLVRGADARVRRAGAVEFEVERAAAGAPASTASPPAACTSCHRRGRRRHQRTRRTGRCGGRPGRGRQGGPGLNGRPNCRATTRSCHLPAPPAEKPAARAVEAGEQPSLPAG